MIGMLLSCLISSHSPSAANDLVSLRHQLAARLDPIVSAQSRGRAQVGLNIVRADTGEELYGSHSDTLLVPASTLKIFSTAAALSGLSTGFQFKTDIVGRRGAGGAIVGDLGVKGEGDPVLIPERLWYLATRLYFMGVREITGDIVVDDSYFDGPRAANGWEEDSSSRAYMAPLGAVSAGYNAVLVHVLPGSAVGQPAQVLIDPISDYTQLKSTVKTVASGRADVDISVTPLENRSQVNVSGRIAVGDAGRGYWRRIDSPPLFTGELIRKSLEQIGITVKGRVREGGIDAAAPSLLTLESPPLGEIIGRLNKHSNNFVASQIAYALGAHVYGPPGNWPKAHNAIEAFLTQQVGLEPGTFELGNASGIHTNNRVTARQLVKVLRYMYGQPALGPEFISSLAVAGSSGTLASRINTGSAAHNLRGKTGTLSTACALAGYITAKSGETLAFAFMVNHYGRRIRDVWAAEDAIAQILAETSLK